MSKDKGLITYKGKGIYWRYKSFKGSSFELHPHFELLAKDAGTGEQVLWDNVKITGDGVTGVRDFEALPEAIRTATLDRCVDILEKKTTAFLNLEERLEIAQKEQRDGKSS